MTSPSGKLRAPRQNIGTGDPTEQDLYTQANALINNYLIPFGWKVLGALAVWIVGGWVIRLLRAGLGRTLLARQVDPTLSRYAEASANVLLKLLLFVAVLSVLGIETTSFAALLAAFGIAIGAAWGGLLANFAAGMFLMVLRPFKVGDMITVGGVTGDVREIGLFVTTLDTVDNVRIFVGNNKIFSDTIFNYSANAYRRVDLKAQLAHGTDPHDAIRRLREALVNIPNVIATPAPDVAILEFNDMGTVLAVRPYCNNAHFWQVFFDANKAINDVGAAATYAAPERRIASRAV
ncbi:MAG: mechanosensitive ion channel family protein [Betaproteobacteria bacterium]